MRQLRETIAHSGGYDMINKNKLGWNYEDRY